MVRPTNIGEASPAVPSTPATTSIRSDDNALSITLGREDTLKDVIELIGTELDHPNVARPNGWEARYAVFIVGRLGQKPEPGDTVSVPLNPGSVLTQADRVTRQLHEIAIECYKSDQTLKGNRERRRRELKQRRALEKRPVAVQAPASGLGFNPRGRQRLSSIASRAVSPSRNDPEASTLSPLHRRFLADFGVRVDQLPATQRDSLARLLDAAQQATKLQQLGALPSAVGGAHFGVERRVRGNLVEYALTAEIDGSTLRLARTFDLETLRLTTSLDFSSDATKLQADVEYDARPRVLELLALRADAVERGVRGEEVDDFSDLIAPETLSNQEGALSFFEGAILGDFGENDSWSAIAGQSVIGFVPIAGQIADARDISASLVSVAEGRNGAWIAFGASVAGIVPGLDFLKSGTRVGREILAEASEEITEGVTAAALKQIRRAVSKEFAQSAATRLKALAAGRVELLARLDELAASSLMQPQWRESLSRARNALQDHLHHSDLAGALRDTLSLPVRRSGSGEAFDHANEVDDALNALITIGEKLSARAEHLRYELPASASELRQLDDYTSSIREMISKTTAFIGMTP